MAAATLVSLAPTGTTGANTHAAVSTPRDATYALAAQFIVEAVGATPTVDWKVQGSLDKTNWYDLAYATNAVDTLATAAITVTGAGAQVIFLKTAVDRAYAWFRLVTANNTNITYRGELYCFDRGDLR